MRKGVQVVTLCDTLDTWWEGRLGLGPRLRSCSQVLLTADTRVWYSDVLSELRGAAVALLIRRS